MNDNLSLYLRYEMVRVTENKPDPTKQERGLFSYLWDKVDIIIKASNEVFKKSIAL